MNEIRALLRLAARRLEWTTFLGQAHLVAVVAAGLALILMLADRAGATTFVPWIWVAPALVALALGIAALRWTRRRRDERSVALVVDERLDLREKITTALHCEGRDDPFAQAAVADAVEVARDPRTREVAGRRFRIAAPPLWWLSPLIVLAALAVGQLRPLDLFSPDEPAPDDAPIVEARHDADETVKAIVEEIEKTPALASSLDDLIGDLTDQGADPDAMRTPEQVKRDAIKKVSELNRRLEEIVSGEQGKTAESLERALAGLETPEDGPAKELAEAMSRGNFSEAAEALQKLQEQLQNGELSEAQQEQLAEQLEQLADQLEQLAQQQQQLEDALKQAGLDPQLAKNPQALEQALKDNPNLNQQQIQQLQQMAQAQQSAQQMCQGMSQAMGQMAQSMQQSGQLGEGAQQMGDQLDQMEQMQMMLKQAQAMASMCQGQCQGLGQGLGRDGNQLGPGMGNRGQGRGGKAPVAPTPFGTRVEKANLKTGEGDIIARMLIDAPPQVGESHREAQTVVAEILEGYEEAVLDEVLPRKYHEANQHYFGELRKLTEARDVPGGDTAKGEGESKGEGDAKPATEKPAEPAEPAESSDDSGDGEG